LLTVVLLAHACAGRDDAAKSDAPAVPTGDQIVRESQDGPVKAKVAVAPAKPKLGDTIALTLTVEAEAGIELEMPPFGEALGRFSVGRVHPAREPTTRRWQDGDPRVPP
jgi:hypothetical protein